jgi:hypothetical protein
MLQILHLNQRDFEIRTYFQLFSQIRFSDLFGTFLSCPAQSCNRKFGGKTGTPKVTGLFDFMISTIAKDGLK